MGFLNRVKTFLSRKGQSGSIFWNNCYYFTKYSIAYFLGKIWSEEHYAKWFYHLYSGKKLNLENPQTFNDKLWWLKLNNRDPMLTKCSDKYLVREYVAQCGFPDILIPQYEVLDSVKNLDLTKYHEEVIAKCNHNSGGHVFYNPQNATDTKKLKKGYKNLAFILKRDASVLSREWNYKNIPRKVVVEKVIRNRDGELPKDYRFFCFNGEPKLLMIDIGVLDENGQERAVYSRNIYDMEFNLLPIHWGRDSFDVRLERPLNFQRMKEIAATLSRRFPMCRVDLYNIDGEIYFGEITFYHGGACQNIEPEEWDDKISSWVDINSPKVVRKLERN